MFVSMDFEVHGEVSPEEAITAVRRYCSNYTSLPTEKVTVHRGPNSIEVDVEMTLVRASHSPLPQEEFPS